MPSTPNRTAATCPGSTFIIVHSIGSGVTHFSYAFPDLVEFDAEISARLRTWAPHIEVSTPGGNMIGVWSGAVPKPKLTPVNSASS